MTFFFLTDFPWAELFLWLFLLIRGPETGHHKVSGKGEKNPFPSSGLASELLGAGWGHANRMCLDWIFLIG